MLLLAAAFASCSCWLLASCFGLRICGGDGRGGGSGGGVADAEAASAEALADGTGAGPDATSPAGAPSAAEISSSSQQHVQHLLTCGKPSLSVSESKTVANFLARQKDVLILCGGTATGKS